MAKLANHEKVELMKAAVNKASSVRGAKEYYIMMISAIEEKEAVNKNKGSA